MDTDEINDRCKRVINQERCLHGMVYEYCAHCQKVEYTEEVKFPLPLKDKHTKEPVLNEKGEQVHAWLRVKATRVRYNHYRPYAGDQPYNRRPTDPGPGRWLPVDRCIVRSKI